ncbi:MAG: PHP domain-containing protein [Planctomycetota bacterium]|jgi:predicted metal-dependent phosphoesterase TrpH
MTELTDRPLRGIIHFHSRYSPDSITTIARILNIAKRLSLDFMILTDHNSIRGSIELARRADVMGLPLEVPIAAEYRTDYGDVIAAFIQKEVVSRDFRSFVSEVGEQGGLILLPHPFVSHREVELLASHAHLIESFNGRYGAAENEAARALALRHRKPCYFSSDGHTTIGLRQVVLSVERKKTLRESLLNGEIHAESCMPTKKADVVFSKLVNIVKTGDVNRLRRYGTRKLTDLIKVFGLME